MASVHKGQMRTRKTALNIEPHRESPPQRDGKTSGSRPPKVAKMKSTSTASILPDDLMQHMARVGFAAARKDTAPYGHLRVANKSVASVIKKAEEDEVMDMCKKAKFSTANTFGEVIPKVIMSVKVPFKGAFYNARYECEQRTPMFGDVTAPIEFITIYRSSLAHPLFKMDIVRNAHQPMAICRYTLHTTSLETIPSDILRLQTFQPLLYKIITCPELATFKKDKLERAFASAPGIVFRLDEVRVAMVRFAEPLNTWNVAIDVAPLTITGLFVQSLDD